MQIESLSPSPAKAVQELSDYNWRSPEARQKYDQIKKGPARPGDARPAVRGDETGPENATTKTVRRSTRCSTISTIRWTNTQEDRIPHKISQDFMAKHWASTSLENPRNVDELLDSLATKRGGRPALPQQRLRPEQRAELDALAQQAFSSPQLMRALNRLDSHLRAARPGEDWDGSSEFSGDNPLGMGQGAQALADIAELSNWPSNCRRAIRAPAWTTSTSMPSPASWVRGRRGRPHTGRPGTR